MAYRGTRYHGFQRQINAITVQEIFENALEEILNHKTTLYGCSRTDTGVHALQFYANFHTESTIPLQGFIRGMNKLLPYDISVLSCEEAPEDFHARFSCKGKAYLYKIHNHESKDPFTEDLSLHYRRPLDTDLLAKAGRAFIGTHDFKAFCSTGSNKENTVRTIYDFTVTRTGDEVELLVKGDGFLYNMVRIMVGTLLFINEGKIPADALEEIIRTGDRKAAGKTAQARGLYLYKVYY